MFLWLVCPAQAEVPYLTYEVIRTYPHDRGAFTQGLVYDGGVLYESTGLYGRSSLRRVDLDTGRVLQRHDLDNRYFGEGIAVLGERIIQLTWRSRIGFVYDLRTFQRIGTFSYPHEGWGLTTDGRKLYVSDGTEVIRVLDPIRFREMGHFRVVEGHGPLAGLNELEYVKGRIFANVWGSDDVVVIDPKTGRVVARLDLRGLLPGEVRTGAEDVLNGIAYDAAGDRFFITGKFWPLVFEIRLTEKTGQKSVGGRKGRMVGKKQRGD